VLLADCRAKRANYGCLFRTFIAKGLNRSPELNPAFNIIDTASQAELDQIAQFLPLSSGFAAYERRWLGIRPRFNEFDLSIEEYTSGPSWYR